MVRTVLMEMEVIEESEEEKEMNAEKKPRKIWKN